MLLVDMAVAIGPILGYVAQLKLIKQTKSIGSFSIDICAILIISNILRLYFWFTTGYAFNLFMQSILVIIIQLMLLQQCIRLKQNSKNNSFFQIESFWRWSTFEQYRIYLFYQVKFIFVFMTTIAIFTIIFQIFTFGFYGQLIGYLSMSIEAGLGLPQLITNYQKKTIKGLSFIMILSWFLGDFLKTIYFVMQKQPFQFIMCGAIQLTVDILIILQIIAYSKDSSLYIKQSKQFDPLPNNQLSTQAQDS